MKNIFINNINELEQTNQAQMVDEQFLKRVNSFIEAFNINNPYSNTVKREFYNECKSKGVFSVISLLQSNYIFSEESLANFIKDFIKEMLNDPENKDITRKLLFRQDGINSPFSSNISLCLDIIDELQLILENSEKNILYQIYDSHAIEHRIKLRIGKLIVDYNFSEEGNCLYEGLLDPLTKKSLVREDDVVKCSICGNFMLKVSWENDKSCCFPGCVGKKFLSKDETGFMSRESFFEKLLNELNKLSWLNDALINYQVQDLIKILISSKDYYHHLIRIIDIIFRKKLEREAIKTIAKDYLSPDLHVKPDFYRNLSKLAVSICSKIGSTDYSNDKENKNKIRTFSNEIIGKYIKNNIDHFEFIKKSFEKTGDSEVMKIFFSGYLYILKDSILGNNVDVKNIMIAEICDVLFDDEYDDDIKSEVGSSLFFAENIDSDCSTLLNRLKSTNINLYNSAKNIYKRITGGKGVNARQTGNIPRRGNI